MNCQEVQLQLSGYLEKSLDAIRMKGIETHLASCPSCRAESRSLSECIALVGALPEVPPPPGFAQRVMAHAREIELEVPLWQRLLAAFRTTAPIQASAVVLVAILALLVYQREPRLRDGGMTGISQLPAELQSPAGSDPAVPEQPSARDTTPDLNADPARERRGRTQTAAPAAPISKPSPAPPKASAPAAPAVPPELPRVVQRRAPIQAQEISTGREPMPPRSDVFGFGASVGALNQPPYGVAPFAAGRAPSPLSEPRADFEFIVRRRPLERRETAEAAVAAPSKRSEADAAIATAAAQRGIPAPAAAASAIVEVRWFSVAPHHFEEFRKELAAEASIDSEKGPASDDPNASLRPARNLLIKVVILPSDR